MTTQTVDNRAAEKTYREAADRYHKARERTASLYRLHADSMLEEGNALKDLRALEAAPGLPKFVHEHLTKDPKDCTVDYCQVHPEKYSDEPF